MKARDYIISMTVTASAQEAFNSINSVSKWWTENIEGGYQN